MKDYEVDAKVLEAAVEFVHAVERAIADDDGTLIEMPCGDAYDALREAVWDNEESIFSLLLALREAVWDNEESIGQGEN
jgi:hypothetical protein